MREEFNYHNIHELTDTPVRLTTKLGDLDGLTPALVKACEDDGIITIADYMRRTDAASFDFHSLMAVPGLGPAKVARLHRAVEGYIGFRKPEDGLALEWANVMFNPHKYPGGQKHEITEPIPEDVILETIERTRPETAIDTESQAPDAGTHNVLG